MRRHWANLNELDRAAFRATTAFLNGRLEERATVDWAIRLQPNDTIKRLALLELIDSPDGQKISEPWRSAWHLIKDSWNHPTSEFLTSTGIYGVTQRLHTGDRSGSLVRAIVELVEPRLKVEPFSDLHLRFRVPQKRPKKVEDLFSTRLTSGGLVNPSELNLGCVTDKDFLVGLARALDAAVVNGLTIAERIGWDGERTLWRLGQLHRVYYVPVADRSEEEHEPDEFHTGIAPSVKLLHAVVSRLADIDISTAHKIIRRWKLTSSPVHLRLWAALLTDSRVTPAHEVGPLLLQLDDRCFWDLHYYPEIAELRAARFGEFGHDEQAMLTARIRKRPPRNHWPRRAEADKVKNARLYWAIRELRRIEISGATLPQRDKAWLDARIDEFPDLVQMLQIDEGFLRTPKAQHVPSRPDSRYDLLAGEDRLKALETAFSSGHRGWDDDPATRAADWMRQKNRPAKVLFDFESTPDGGAAFPEVWERFGWAHSPEAERGENAVQRNFRAEGARVLSLLASLPEATIRQAIDGISQWLSDWAKQIVDLPEGLGVWLKLWPIAVEATDAVGSVEDEADLNVVVQSSDDGEPMDLDTLNTPAGKLVGVFLAARPHLKENGHPFESDGALRKMRDTMIAVSGRSGLIARYRMIEELSYFFHADRVWTDLHLITPLVANDLEAKALWRAVTRKPHFSDVLQIIGGQMAERATDRRLGRETRRSLVFSLVVECLYSFHEQRDPAVPYDRIQQMIRFLDDEVRADGARAVLRFVRDVSVPLEKEPAPPSPEELFRTAAAPFLQQVWPQERSLATPGVSQALADLPASAQGAFAEAVDAIERFLVPFECWSMLDYGLYGQEDGSPKLSIIGDRKKAAAFLRLLDLTIGTAEGAVIPYELADALDQVRMVAPRLAGSRVFRRLATAARRG